MKLFILRREHRHPASFEVTKRLEAEKEKTKSTLKVRKQKTENLATRLVLVREKLQYVQKDTV